MREILEKHGDSKEVTQLLTEYQENLLGFMEFFSQKYECKSFVIGGNIVKAWDRIFPDKSVLEGFDVQIGQYQEHAAIIGAASLFSNGM